MKNLIPFKSIALYVPILLCCTTFCGCSNEEQDAIQAEVVFTTDADLNKIDQWECSLELDQWSSIIPFEIKSNSEWEISFHFDDEKYFCLAYPNKGVGNGTVELCVFNNLSDGRCTGKMYIVFPKDLSKCHIVQLSQKGNLDNDENNNPLEIRSGVKCPDCEDFIPISIADLLTKDGVKCPHCGLFIPMEIIERIRQHEVDEFIANLRNGKK